MFTLRESYTRNEIHARLGGNKQWYLPIVRGRVVCACLTPKADPDAPCVILPGEGEIVERTADLLMSQRSAIPTFIKRRAGHWEYVGEFFPVECSRDAHEIAAQARRSGRNNITRVIHMAPAVPAGAAD
jgi:hypothetical protein